MSHISHWFTPIRILVTLLILWVLSESSMTAYAATSCAQFEHYIFANPLVATQTVTNSGLTDGTAIADGTSKSFNITLNDVYDNQIIPATGPSFTRTVTMSLTGVTNTMYLDQYSRSGTWSIYVKAPDNSESALTFASTGQLFPNNMSSITNWFYPLGIKAYTPSSNWYTWATDPISDSSAQFGFTTQITVTDPLISSRVFSWALANPSFKPLYETRIVGDLKEGGFIEGTMQSGSINIFNNNPWKTASGLQLQLAFSGTDSNKFQLYGWNFSGTLAPIATRGVMTTNSGIVSTRLFTKLIQNQNTILNEKSSLQLSTHFGYELDGKQIIYNSDVIGKIGGVFNTTPYSLWIQAGVKIIGMIWGSNILSLLNDQFTTGTALMWWVSRSTIRNNIRKSVAIATRNIVVNTTYSDTIASTEWFVIGSGINGAIVTFGADKSIMIIHKNGWKVTMNLAWWIAGVRTIVIKGADLYINNNMYYNPAKPNSILWVVVQKDDAGVGWNLYINPSVTNVVGSYVLDGSIMSSSDGFNPLGSSNITILKNQLHIYGSIVSENTIGGSRMSPLKCPSLIGSCANIEEAQKYDLNYLRRYYLYDGKPFGTGTVIGWGTCTPSCSWFNSNLIRKFIDINDPLAKNPVIIEYNPRVNSLPPIGFEQSRY